MTMSDQGDSGPEGATSVSSNEAPEEVARFPAGLKGVKSVEADYRYLTAIVNASRDAIWSWELDGTIVSWNAAAERLFQYSADEIVGESIFSLIPPERHERARAAVSKLGDGNWYGQYETERVRKDGRPIPVELTVSPILDASGRTIAAATICRDITERKQAEEARQQLAAIVDSSEDAIVAKDLDGVINSWNRGAERLFGYTAREVAGKSITIIIPPDYRHEEERILERIRRGEHVEPYDTLRQRKDGTLVDISLSVSPVKDPGGGIVGASKIARDITERKRAEHLRKLLTRELNHRVRNTLAIVQAMANQTFMNVPEAAASVKTFKGRLGALSAANDLLTRENWEQVPMTELVRDSIATAGQSERIEIDGPSVTLDPRAAVTVSMALHELCTNAIKHGALASPTGIVSIAWDLAGTAEPRLTLTWQERGGPPVAPPTRRGFGVLMLEHMLSQDLGGKVSLEFRSQGVICTMGVPLSAAPAQTGQSAP